MILPYTFAFSYIFAFLSACRLSRLYAVFHTTLLKFKSKPQDNNRKFMYMTSHKHLHVLLSQLFDSKKHDIINTTVIKSLSFTNLSIHLTSQVRYRSYIFHLHLKCFDIIFRNMRGSK